MRDCIEFCVNENRFKLSFDIILTESFGISLSYIAYFVRFHNA